MYSYKYLLPRLSVPGAKDWRGGACLEQRQPVQFQRLQGTSNVHRRKSARQSQSRLLEVFSRLIALDATPRLTSHADSTADLPVTA